jgi:S1-C subfamily serine protease
MNQKIKTQKGFISIPILIAIIFSVVVASVIGYGTVEYRKTSKIVKEAEQLTKEEKYDEAIKKLEFAQNKLVGKILNQKINTELEKNKKLLEDKTEYTQGIEEFNKGNWEKTKELLSKVSEISPYYQEAKNKVEETQKKLTEKQIAEAVEKATEEIKKKAEEGKKAAEEVEKRIEEEKAKRVAVETQKKVEEKKSREKMVELEQKLKELEQKQVLPHEEYFLPSLTKEQISAVVMLACPDDNFEYNGFLSLGSGVIINPEGNIFTNRHVVSNQDGSIIESSPTCFVGITDDISQPPKYKYLADLVAYSPETTEYFNFDVAVLYIYGVCRECENAPLSLPSRFPYLELGYSDVLIPGSYVAITGYPEIGVGTWSLTNGIISGRVGDFVLKTDAKIDFGNSGGAALNNMNQLIGIDQIMEWYNTQVVFEKPPESLWCNGQYWSPCSSDKKFHCPKTGDPFCYSRDAVVCNDKIWSLCPAGQNFYCPPIGDPYCQ